MKNVQIYSFLLEKLVKIIKWVQARMFFHNKNYIKSVENHIPTGCPLLKYFADYSKVDCFTSLLYYGNFDLQIFVKEDQAMINLSPIF